MTAVLSARIDGDGRLLDAEGELAALNARAGGEMGAPLALAPLAGVVRLAQRLGIVVSRAVTVADTDTDIELWARARPEDGGVRLAVSG